MRFYTISFLEFHKLGKARRWSAEIDVADLNGYGPQRGCQSARGSKVSRVPGRAREVNSASLIDASYLLRQ